MVWNLKRRHTFLVVVLLGITEIAVIGGCGSSSDDREPTATAPSPTPTPTVVQSSPEAKSPKVISEVAQLSKSITEPYFATHQIITEGVYSTALDLRDLNAVFRAVFFHLPAEVTVYPSENYYYFKLFVNGREFWGNIRLAAGHRERGELSFAYFEFDEFAYNRGPQFTRAKVLTQTDGVIVKEIDRFTYTVTYEGKTVKFNLLRLPQDPPRLFQLGKDEVFIERTFDESGYQFFLLFNQVKKFFFWVLNEEGLIPDTLDKLGDTTDLLRGRRSGFVFWVDSRYQDRKVLASIRQQSVERNDYFDGPFDQLADNYADEVRVSEFIVKASPSLEGKIDKFGYFTDQENAMRVALSMYATHYYDQQVLDFMQAARASADIYEYISRRGVPQYNYPAPTATPTPTVTVSPTPTATPKPSTPTP